LESYLFSAVIYGLGEWEQRCQQNREQRPHILILHNSVEPLEEAFLGWLLHQTLLLLLVDVAAEQVVQVQRVLVAVVLVRNDDEILVRLNVVGRCVKVRRQLVVANQIVGFDDS